MMIVISDVIVKKTYKGEGRRGGWKAGGWLYLPIGLFGARFGVAASQEVLVL